MVVLNLLKRILKLIQRFIPGYMIRVQFLRWSGYHVGRQTFIGEDLLIIDEFGDRGMVFIGERVAIAPRVTLVTSSYPNHSRIRPYVPAQHGKIHIEDDVWIGTGVIVFPNVCIHQGAVIGAGSLVLEDVPPYTIAYGVPARVMRRIEIPEGAR